MVNITNQSECCGCTACANICNHEAISMKPDALGFLYPVVDSSKCTNCRLCEKVCSFNDHYDISLNFEVPFAYGARQKSIDEVMKSRSGAVFAALSDYVLEKNGVVYGAGYTDHFKVKHKRATTKHERDEFRGSKYVQSDLNTVFRQVKQDLQENRLVLFSGTACQTSGLQSYIGKKLRKNLILVDIVCHGVASPYIWRDYITYLEKKYNDTIVSLHFRDKARFGWNTHKETFRFSKESYSKTFNFLFYKSLYFRRSCYSCHFTNIRRPSDITLADYWGVEKNLPKINVDNKGCNLVLLSTNKGVDLFKAIKDKLNFEAVNLQTSLQPNLQQPSAMPSQRNQFEEDYIRMGFNYIYFKYGEYGWRYKVNVYKEKIKFKMMQILGVK